MWKSVEFFEVKIKEVLISEKVEYWPGREDL